VGSHLPNSSQLPQPAMFVEFAHIYADTVFGSEQDRSLSVMKDYLDTHSTPDSLVVSAILIDDLHVEEATLDVMEFVRCILRRGLAPDFVVFEGKLGEVADELVSRIWDNSNHELVWRTIKKTNKRVLTYVNLTTGREIGIKTIYDDARSEWTCAMLSAAWTLCRAGIYEFPKDSIVRLTEAPVTGDKIVSVLHSKYEGVEAKVVELIKAAGYGELVDRLELVFFD
jgi:hypothetical protein